MSAAGIVFAICAFACLLGHGAILHSVIRSRSAHVDPRIPRPRLLVEVLWALVPAIVLVFLLTATWDRMRDRAIPAPAVMMKIAR